MSFLASIFSSSIKKLWTLLLYPYLPIISPQKVIMADIFAQNTAVNAVLPVIAQTEANRTVFHVIRLPNAGTRPPGTVLSEWAIQPGSDNVARQACWWTSYIIFAKKGLLHQGTGVYTSWNEFATLSSTGSFMNVQPRPDGIIFHMTKGVTTGFLGNAAFTDEFHTPRGVPYDSDVYVCLVVAGMHDGRYQVHGQARLTLG
jgi:hypothetical protein